MRAWLTLAVLALTSLTGTLQGSDAGLIKISGPIGPATASFISRAIHLAETRQNACLLIQLDTPGGLLDSTKEIVQSFYASTVPTVVFVAPSGATATSAGCFITMAADVAAMAPNTSIGAAHPVAIGGGEVEKMDDVMKTKLENFASSYIQAIAEKRGRNAQWATTAVRDSASITAEEALKEQVIDVIAADSTELLNKLEGRKVGDKVLKTAGARVVEIPMLARETLFQMLWRPEVMLVLTLAAIYGILGELSNPGAILPGVVGGIALVLVLYMSAILPVNIAGLAFIFLSMVLFGVDIFATTHGVLTAGGVVSFFLGALMLFNGAEPGFQLSLGYIIPATILTAVFFIFVVGAGLRAQLLPVRTGKEAMLGRTTSALMRIDQTGGKVFFEGEYWNAVSEDPVEPGATVQIVGITGLTLKVKPAGA